MRALVLSFPKHYASSETNDEIRTILYDLVQFHRFPKHYASSETNDEIRTILYDLVQFHRFPKHYASSETPTTTVTSSETISSRYSRGFQSTMLVLKLSVTSHVTLLAVAGVSKALC